MLISIGEFSKATGLSIKTLRFYHEQNLLAPAYVDPHTGYRNYSFGQIEIARVITQLRNLEFPLKQIGEILANCEDEADILVFLEGHRARIREKLIQFRDALTLLDKVIHQEREARMTIQNSAFDVEEKVLEPLLMAGVRQRGPYSDCGKGFAKIGKELGRYISGKPFLLHYDTEYKEQDADFEACMPVRKAKDVAGVSVRKLPGGKCVALLHKGPYSEMSRSYSKILAYIHEKGYEVMMPTREVYLKGPGMIFKGNPKNYLTEIQMIVGSSNSS